MRMGMIGQLLRSGGNGEIYTALVSFLPHSFDGFAAVYISFFSVRQKWGKRDDEVNL